MSTHENCDVAPPPAAADEAQLLPNIAASADDKNMGSYGGGDDEPPRRKNLKLDIGVAAAAAAAANKSLVTTPCHFEYHTINIDRKKDTNVSKKFYLPGQKRYYIHYEKIFFFSNDHGEIEVSIPLLSNENEEEDSFPIYTMNFIFDADENKQCVKNFKFETCVTTTNPAVTTTTTNAYRQNEIVELPPNSTHYIKLANVKKIVNKKNSFKRIQLPIFKKEKKIDETDCYIIDLNINNYNQLLSFSISSNKYKQIHKRYVVHDKKKEETTTNQAQHSFSCAEK